MISLSCTIPFRHGRWFVLLGCRWKMECCGLDCRTPPGFCSKKRAEFLMCLSEMIRKLWAGVFGTCVLSRQTFVVHVLSWWFRRPPVIHCEARLLRDPLAHLASKHSPGMTLEDFLGLGICDLRWWFCNTKNLTFWKLGGQMMVVSTRWVCQTGSRKTVFRCAECKEEFPVPFGTRTRSLNSLVVPLWNTNQSHGIQSLSHILSWWARGVQAPSKRKVFRFQYYFQKVIGSLGNCFTFENMWSTNYI